MVWFAIALSLHLVVGYFYLLSGLTAPSWAVQVLMIIWIGLSVFLFRIRREGPKTLLIPLLAVAIWFLALWAGDTFLDWTA